MELILLNKQIYVDNCIFENTGGSGFVPNKSENVLVQNCILIIQAHQLMKGCGKEGVVCGLLIVKM